VRGRQAGNHRRARAKGASRRRFFQGGQHFPGVAVSLFVFFCDGPVNRRGERFLRMLPGLISRWTKPTGFQDKMVTGHLGVIRKLGMAIGHPTEEKCVMLGESENLPLCRASGDRERDCHAGILLLPGNGSVNPSDESKAIPARVARDFVVRQMRIDSTCFAAILRAA